MKYAKLKTRHDDLEQEVLNALREEIEKSKEVSDHMDTKVLNVNEELAIINGELTFMDDNGHHYGIYSECSLEDLIDILSKI